MHMETKQDIFNEYKEKYFKARSEKRGGRAVLTQILDIVCEVTKMHRKAVVRKFNHLQTREPTTPEGRGRRVYYTPDVTAALKQVWDAGAEVCGELLHPIINEYVDIFIRDRDWHHSDSATGKLRSMSEGTVKLRVGTFMKARRTGKGVSSTSPSLLKHLIPIFHGDWSEKPPGSGQIDTVVHCGPTLIGDMAYTLNYTDVPTLWVVLRAQWNKSQEATHQGLSYIRDVLPWLLIYVHPDTGSEFINWFLKKWCDLVGIDMERSRPGKSNDNMHVEERNGHIVRKWIGYPRLDCREAVTALNCVYEVLNPYLNHFVASRRVIEKYEVNGRWKKRYEKVAKTPYQRVLAHPGISEEVKEKLRQEHALLNPAVLRKEIEKRIRHLYAVQRKQGATKVGVG
jgi:hypothetical protein